MKAGMRIFAGRKAGMMMIRRITAGIQKDRKIYR